jgi:hypothetical protein
MVARRALALVLVASLLAASIPSAARAAANTATGPAVAFGNLLLRDTEVQQLLDSVVSALPAATVEQIETLAQLAGSGATPQEIEQQLQVVVCSLPTATQLNIQQLISRLSLVGGFGLAAAAILKFKEHKDNPQQVHVPPAVALFFIAVALLLIPSKFVDCP